MAPRRADGRGLEFDARGRLKVPEAIMLLYDDMQEVKEKLLADFKAINSLSCKQTPPGACTQQVQLPQDADTEAAKDRVLGWTVRKLWGTIPHGIRCLLVVGSSLCGGLALPHLGSVLHWAASLI